VNHFLDHNYCTLCNPQNACGETKSGGAECIQAPDPLLAKPRLDLLKIQQLHLQVF
jgi:hypothetical protein